MRFELDLAALDALPSDQRRKALAVLRKQSEAHKRNPLWRFDPLDPNGTGIPHVKQHEWMSAHGAAKRLFLGGNRSGKTTAGVVADIIDACDVEAVPPHLQRYKRWHDPIQMFLVAVDNRAIQTIHLPKFREWCPRDQLVGGTVDRALDKELMRLNFKNGSWIQFMTQRMEVDAFAGASLHRVHFDEEPLYDHGRDIYNECLARLIDHGGDMLITMTPLLGMTWLYDELYLPWERVVGPMTDSGWAERQLDERHRERIFIAKVDMDDNPTLNAEGKAIALAAMSTEEQRSARKAGRFVSFSGKVYDRFDQSVHVIPDAEARKALEPENLQRLAVGVDPGFRHMAGIVYVARTAEQLVVVAELPLKETIIAEVCKRIHLLNDELRVRPHLYPADPAILKRDSQTGKSDQVAFIEAGIPAFPGQNDVRPGINAIRGLLEVNPDTGAPGLVIAASCVELIEEFNRYRWVQPKRTEHAPREQPVKRDDHLLDALRYAIMALPRPEPRPTIDDRPRLARLIDEELEAIRTERHAFSEYV